MSDTLSDGLARLRRREPWLWSNPNWRPLRDCLPKLPFGLDAVLETEARLRRFAPLLADLFPELRSSGGIIESEFRPLSRWARAEGLGLDGRLWMKADHALPVAGSIKARGGIYAVLHFAERVALAEGLLRGLDDDFRQLNTPAARAAFARYELTAGSTGNLGLSIGIIGAALGFRSTIHMSAEAKEWKKERLRRRGVTVVEHRADYSAACAQARALAEADPRAHFIDDENSIELFLGYSVAARRLQRQLRALDIPVDGRHPLFLYLPCGVGGAPGGITFGARQVFGDHAICLFAEPVEAPCMLLGMLTGKHADASVYDLGLRLATDADGLAVPRPSRFVGKLMEPLLSGIYTVSDRQLYRDLQTAWEREEVELEPSACAGFSGPRRLLDTDDGQALLRARGLDAHLDRATHIIWTTGGALVPAEQHEQFRQKARELAG